MTAARVTCYHNQRCSKSRSTLSLLEEAGVEVQVINYLETPPSSTELDHLLKLLGKEPQEIVRTGEDRYEELGLKKNPPKTRKAWLDLLVKNPILIERPIVTDGKRAVLGRPPENVQVFIK